MGEKIDKQKIDELKEMIQENPSDQPVEKVLVKFCERHGVSLDTCRVYYEKMERSGELKTKKKR